MSNANANLQEVLAYLKKAGVFYLATTEGDQPRVRPFGAAAEFEGKIYMVSSNRKKCFDQMVKNDKIELSAMVENTWIRVEAKAGFDSRREARQRMMEEYPSLSSLYSVDDGKMEALYLKDAVATIYSFSGDKKVLRF